MAKITVENFLTVPRRCIPLSCLTARLLLHTFCCHPWNVKEGIASRLYLDCEYCLARLQKDITALYQPTNEKVGYITVLETLTGPTEIIFHVRESLKKEIDQKWFICASSKSTPLSSFDDNSSMHLQFRI
jgi:hypothetical protein